MNSDSTWAGNMRRGLSYGRAPGALASAICDGAISPAFRTSVCNFYPCGDGWLSHKVIPDLESGVRRVLVLYANQSIYGVAIIKLGLGAKLCSFWLSEEIRGNGAAKGFFEYCLWQIGDKFPLFTVPGELLDGFQSLLSKFEFVEIDKLDSFYRPASAELVFNHPLDVGKGSFESRHSPLRPFLNEMEPTAKNIGHPFRVASFNRNENIVLRGPIHCSAYDT